jgi:hypothetical protein
MAEMEIMIMNFKNEVTELKVSQSYDHWFADEDGSLLSYQGGALCHALSRAQTASFGSS